MLVESADNFRATDVSFSSSFTNVLERPLDAEKKITIHSSPVKISLSIFSSPRAKRMIEIVTNTNIKSELMTYLDLSSDLMSFLKTNTDV
jgi:hypothetical protein